MREKISLALKLRERINYQNLSLKSFAKLPNPLKKLLFEGKINGLIIYQKQAYPVQIKPSDEQSFLLSKSLLPNLNTNEIILLVIPQELTRYIFQGKVLEVQEDFYLIGILDPRSEPRILITKPVPAFISILPKEYIQRVFQNDGWSLLREINFANEVEFQSLSEIHIYDLILNEKLNVEEEFTKQIQRIFLTGFLKDLSRSGACVAVKGKINFDPENLVFYLRFEIHEKAKLLKFALLSLLKGFSIHGEETFLHFNHLTSLKPMAWDLIQNWLESTQSKEGFKEN